MTEPRSSSSLKPYQYDAVLDGFISTEQPEVLYMDIELVGHGATADIFKSLDRRSNSVVAIKKFKTKTRSREDFEEIVKEIKFLKACKSEFLTNILGAYFAQQNRVWIVMDFCLGSVFDALQAFKQPLLEPEIRAITWNTVKALEYLHDSEKLHRDVKAKNILIAEGGRVKLADFGVSADLVGREGKCNTFTGSPYWMAPEVIMAMEDGVYSYPADIWSLGITLIEMAEMNPPLIKMQAMSALFHIPQQEPPTFQSQDWSDDMQSFLAACMHKEPKDRSTALQLLQHPFISNGATTSTPAINALISRSLTVVREEMDLSGIQARVENPTAAEAATSEATAAATIDEDVSMSEASSTSSVPVAAAAPTIAPMREPRLSAEQEATIANYKYNTIKRPSRKAADISETKANAVIVGQMKVLRKLQKRSAEDKKGLARRRRQDELTLTRKLGEKRDELRRQHEKIESLKAQEREGELAALLANQTKERKRYKEDLDSQIKRRKKDYKANVSQLKSDLKAEHKALAKDEQKAQRSEYEKSKEAVETRLKDEFEARAATFETAGLKMLRARQTMTENRLKHQHLEQELELQEEHLVAKTELEAEHKTRPIHELLRDYLRQQQELEVQYQEERHEIECKHLQESHEQSRSNLTKKQATQTYANKKKLKKMSVLAPEVQEEFQNSTKNVPELRDLDGRLKTASKTEAKELEKLKKTKLKAAREEVSQKATIKLTTAQLKEKNNLNRSQQQELEGLQQHQAKRRAELEATHEEQRKDLETRVAQEMDAAEQVLLLGCVSLSGYDDGKAMECSTSMAVDVLLMLTANAVQSYGAQQLPCPQRERNVPQQPKASGTVARTTSVDRHREGQAAGLRF
eukprot:TRINITY_DN12124_c0_g1_i6.p1 TRINITY_DN12124_c0_g1~~TRINITY_DN12124_c0_g1_i6.p1  ORF type:complete len:865 (+),score=247.45 TRINITY_DN12124_c0_g1_i6:170-2764(+)